ncbi:hypothetical protein PV08_08165 [Exophiala spinifera]|uniref:HMG box domain-containing protein n=1 Tax=Exophiala spinifera TaxID=91928 RepID=A0A0D2B273_9EURO|nr:uncharacterized protein PV08_08165 [Exophiala spinifera]KIW12978.1 hypothetical protein PV08_08165 [Exophiala spinifera]
MAVFPVPRTLASRLLARTTRSFTRPSPVNPLLRVVCNSSANKSGDGRRGDWSDLTLFYKDARTYATATKKPAGKPKAHVGRAAAGKKKATPKKKATKKPKKKAVKKPKAKKAPSKTALAQQARKALSDLRAAALLEEPKQLPSTAFSVILVEEAKKSKAFAGSATAASEKYRNLSSEEREQYNHQANQNKQQNTIAYKNWVQSYTPLQIKQANNARHQLTKKAKAAGKKTKYPTIQDDRAVKAPRNAYTFFFTDRHLSGDMSGMSVGESGKLLGREWKNLSAAEKKPYNDKADADRARYVEECRSVYGVDPVIRKRAPEAS